MEAPKTRTEAVRLILDERAGCREFLKANKGHRTSDGRWPLVDAARLSCREDCREFAAAAPRRSASVQS